MKAEKPLDKKIIEHLVDCKACQRTLLSHMILNGEWKP